MFMTSGEIGSAPAYAERARAVGYRIVVVPERLRDKLANATDLAGDPIVDLGTFSRRWNEIPDPDTATLVLATLEAKLGRAAAALDSLSTKTAAVLTGILTIAAVAIATNHEVLKNAGTIVGSIIAIGAGGLGRGPRGRWTL